MKITKMTKEYAMAIAQWQYESPYDLYNMSENYGDLMTGYFAVIDSVLIGFCCFGVEAQVPPANYEKNAIDIGLGMNPNMCGKGNGEKFLKLIEEYAKGYYKKPLRLTVVEFNLRAIKLYTKCGFKEISSFDKADRKFIIMIK